MSSVSQCSHRTKLREVRRVVRCGLRLLELLNFSFRRTFSVNFCEDHSDLFFEPGET